MATKVTIRLDRRGIAELLKSAQMREMVDEAAERIASQARSGLPSNAGEVTVHPYVTDRCAASVMVQDPRSLAWQAQNGLLTRAAGSIGADVKRRG